MADLNLIKRLREATGCGIADCNKALLECKDDFEKSVDWLRKKGLSSAAKKSGRIASEGVIAIHIENNKIASIIELNSETDFVARNQKFQEFASILAKNAIKFGSDVEKMKISNISDGNISIDESIKNQIGIIGENINLRRIESVKLDKNGLVVSYVHNMIAPNIGKIGVLIALESEAESDKLQEIGKQIAMHIAATKPEALSISLVKSENLKRETEVLKEQARVSGKPESIIDKMIEGRIRKYYEEVVLEEQFFVMDDKIKIKDLIVKFSKENSATKIIDFKIFVLGDGIEKKENDFAAEVASMTVK